MKEREEGGAERGVRSYMNVYPPTSPPSPTLTLLCRHVPTLSIERRSHTVTSKASPQKGPAKGPLPSSPYLVVSPRPHVERPSPQKHPKRTPPPQGPPYRALLPSHTLLWRHVPTLSMKRRSHIVTSPRLLQRGKGNQGGEGERGTLGDTFSPALQVSPGGHYSLQAAGDRKGV